MREENKNHNMAKSIWPIIIHNTWNYLFWVLIRLKPYSSQSFAVIMVQKWHNFIMAVLYGKNSIL